MEVSTRMLLSVERKNQFTDNINSTTKTCMPSIDMVMIKFVCEKFFQSVSRASSGGAFDTIRNI